MHVRPVLRDPSLVLAFEGWNDAGEAATSAVRYLIDAIHAAPLAEIDPEDFYDFTVRRPTVEVSDDGDRSIAWPVSEFRFGSIDANREIVLGCGVEPHFQWRTFCELIEALVADLAVQRVVLLGAYLADVVYSRPVSVTGFSSSPQLLDKLSVEPSHYEGPTGIVGVLGDRLRRAGVEMVSLWVGLPHYISAAPNPRGSLALIQKLTQCLGIRIDQEPLQASAAEFEQRISALVSGDPELSEYVKQLKKREFAQ